MEWIDSIEELVDYDDDDDDEVEVDDDSNNNILDIGKGRSYDCVFCKRGFNTAQALGGHMNIHRKDRAKTNTTIIKPDSTTTTTTTTTKQADDQDTYSCPPFYQPTSGYYPWYAAAAHGEPKIHNNSHISYNISPASTTSIHNLQGSIGSTIPFRGDPCMGLSLQFGTVNFSQELVANRRNQREDDGLDLELRLGYYP